jgi:hypothetical protein
VEEVQMNNDDSEDFDDEYFEERDERAVNVKRNKKKGNAQGKQYNNNNGRVLKRDDSPDVVYHEKLNIQPEEGYEEDFDDDYYEERDSKTWKNGKNKVLLNKNQEKVTKNYFKKGQYVNHNRNDTPERVYVENVHIQNEDSDEDYDDDYFEERDLAHNKNKPKHHTSKNNKREQPRHHNPTQNKNLFKNSKIDSGINYNSANSSNIRTSGDNPNHLLSGRFQSFAPKPSDINNHNNHNTNNANNLNNANTIEVEFAHVESTNYGDPDLKRVGKETKGPKGRWESQSHSQAYDSAKKTAYTSNSRHQDGQENEVHFKNPYNAQIFSNQESYRRNQSKRHEKPGNSYTDYYQTGGGARRF